MKYLNLETFTDFVCTGSACEFTCCGGGWNIYIDDKTDEYYRSVTGPMGERLKKCIRRQDGVNSFILDENGDCPFLNDRGLCDIYIGLGEEHLSDTCTSFPRYRFLSGDICFAGVSMACPEVAKFFLTHELPLQIDFSEDGQRFSNETGVDWNAFNHSVRAFTCAVEIAQNRDLTVKERIALITVFIYRFQSFSDERRDPSALIDLFSDMSQYILLLPDTGIYNRTFDSKIGFCSEILSYFSLIEQFEDRLPEMTELLEYFRDPANAVADPEKWTGAFNWIDDSSNSIWQENVLVYVLFRYFMQGFDDRDYYDRLMIGLDLVYNANNCSLAMYHIKNGHVPSDDYRRLLITHISRIVEHSSDFRNEMLTHLREDGMCELAFILGLAS